MITERDVWLQGYCAWVQRSGVGSATYPDIRAAAVVNANHAVEEFKKKFSTDFPLNP
jgi:hypothetical protein